MSRNDAQVQKQPLSSCAEMKGRRWKDFLGGQGCVASLPVWCVFCRHLVINTSPTLRLNQRPAQAFSRRYLNDTKGARWESGAAAVATAAGAQTDSCLAMNHTSSVD